jgi:hypothetical protein
MAKTAFITYNAVGEDAYPSGWLTTPQGNAALVLQGTKGRKYEDGPMTRSDGTRDVEGVQDEVEKAWQFLEKHLPELDHVVVYVGARGSENAISHAARLPAHKVTLVMCDCSLDAKDELIERAGLTEAHVIICGCGGHAVMQELLEEFLATGAIRCSCNKPHSLRPAVA